MTEAKDLEDVHMILMGTSDNHAYNLLLDISCIPYCRHISLPLEWHMLFFVKMLQRVNSIYKRCLGVSLFFNILFFVSVNHRDYCMAKTLDVLQFRFMLAVYYRQLG